MDYAIRPKKECLMFKVDFKKVYGNVRWDFHRYMLKRMGFAEV